MQTASQKQFKMGGCFSSAPMHIQCPFPPSHFQLTSSIGTNPSKAVLQLTKFTKRNSYILICKPQHETEAPMIPDARHTWIWTVHLKVPGGNHRALVLQKYMTKSIQNSFLTIEFVSWWSFQQTSTNSSFLLVNPAKMLPTYADVPEPTACSKLSQTGFHCWTGSCYYIMLYRLYPPLENRKYPWTYPKLKASEVCCF